MYSVSANEGSKYIVYNYKCAVFIVFAHFVAHIFLLMRYMSCVDKKCDMFMIYFTNFTFVNRISTY